jgi:predicted nucleic acid-binding protein
VTATLLIDNSAWVRLGDEAVPEWRRRELAAAFESGLVATCLPFMLEAGYSARSARDHDRLVDELLALPCLHIDGDVERRALEAQRQLAQVGHHRLPPVDLLIAGIADRHDVAVLHYDGDYDLIAEKTDLRLRSEWLCPRGTL